MKLNDDKITSYKELVPLLQEIKDRLEKLNRGFVFATLPKDDGEKNRKPLVCISNQAETGIENLISFWAGLMTLVEALNKEIPEDEREQWKETWLTFIRATNSLCFPTLQIEKSN